MTFCITQKQNEAKKSTNWIIHSFRGRPGNIIYYNHNNQCCSVVLLSFRSTEIILTHSRKIRNTQLRFRFLKFLSCVKTISVDLKLNNRPRCNIGYYYIQVSIWLSFCLYLTAVHYVSEVKKYFHGISIPFFCTDLI